MEITLGKTTFPVRQPSGIESAAYCRAYFGEADEVGKVALECAAVGLLAPSGTVSERNKVESLEDYGRRLWPDLEYMSNPEGKPLDPLAILGAIQPAPAAMFHRYFPPREETDKAADFFGGGSDPGYSGVSVPPATGSDAGTPSMG
jgi:hypothetical protein